ncbi:hypothetical protein ACMYYO_12300 [Dermacoccaceae bacterium W4C1]
MSTQDPHSSSDPYGQPGPSQSSGQQGQYGQPGPSQSSGQYGQPGPSQSSGQYGQPGPSQSSGQYGQQGQYGSAPQYGQANQPYGAAPQYDSGQQYYGGGYGQQAPQGRPGTVVAACVMSWIGGALMLGLGLLFALMSGTQSFQDSIQDSAPEIGDDAQALGIGIGIFMLVWALLVIVPAIFVWKGKLWATIILTVLGGIYLLLGIVGIAGNPAALLSVLYVGGVLALLWLRPSQDFYRRSK